MDFGRSGGKIRPRRASACRATAKVRLWRGADVDPSAVANVANGWIAELAAAALRSPRNGIRPFTANVVGVIVSPNQLRITAQSLSNWLVPGPYSGGILVVSGESLSPVSRITTGGPYNAVEFDDGSLLVLDHPFDVVRSAHVSDAVAIWVSVRCGSKAESRLRVEGGRCQLRHSASSDPMVWNGLDRCERPCRWSPVRLYLYDPGRRRRPVGRAFSLSGRPLPDPQTS